MSSKFQWINIFLRDALLAVVIVWINSTLDYESWFAACLAGMIIVLTTWHLNEFIKINGGLKNGLHGLNDNNSSSIGIVHNNLQ